MSNLKQDAGPVLQSLALTRDAAQIGSAVTSIAIVGIIAHSKAIEILPPLWAMAMTVFCVALFIGVVELGLRKFLPYVFDDVLSGRFVNEERKKKAYRVVFWFFGVIVVLGLAFATGATSWEGRKDMVEAATPAPTLLNVEKLSESNQAEREKERARYDAMISEAQKTEAKRIKQAEKQAKALVEKAQNSKGSKMAKLAASGNGWAQNQISSAVKAAEAEGKSLIDSERGKVEYIQGLREKYLNNLQAEHSTSIQAASSVNEKTTMTYAEKFDRNSKMLGIFGVGCLILNALCVLMLSLARQIADEPTFKPATSNPFRFSLTSLFDRFRAPQIAARGSIGFANKSNQSQNGPQGGVNPGVNPGLTPQGDTFTPPATTSPQNASTGLTGAYADSRYFIDKYPAVVRSLLAGSSKNEAASSHNLSISTVKNVKRAMRTVGMIDVPVH